MQDYTRTQKVGFALLGAAAILDTLSEALGAYGFYQAYNNYQTPPANNTLTVFDEQTACNALQTTCYQYQETDMSCVTVIENSPIALALQNNDTLNNPGLLPLMVATGGQFAKYTLAVAGTALVVYGGPAKVDDETIRLVS